MIEPNNLEQVLAADHSSAADRTAGVVIEFELDDENILLLRAEGPRRTEVLDLLEISRPELRALFQTAAKLLAGTNPEDRMRAYAARDASGQWQVTLLDP